MQDKPTPEQAVTAEDVAPDFLPEADIVQAQAQDVPQAQAVVETMSTAEDNGKSESKASGNKTDIVEELNESKEQEYGSGLERVPTLATNGERALEGVLPEDVSGVSDSRGTGVQAGSSSNDDASGNGRAGESGIQLPRSLGNDTREVHSSAARTRSDGRVGDGRLDNQPASTPVAPDKNQSTAETSETFGSQAVKDNDAIKQSDTQGSSSVDAGVNQDGKAQSEEAKTVKPMPVQAVTAEDVAPDFPP